MDSVGGADVTMWRIIVLQIVAEARSGEFESILNCYAVTQYNACSFSRLELLGVYTYRCDHQRRKAPRNMQNLRVSVFPISLVLLRHSKHAYN